MAPPAGTLRVGRYFLALGLLFAVLYALVFASSQSPTPKLGLDLVGGAQVILQASTPDGKAPSKDSMNEARTIIEDRVNGRGVSNSQVAIEGANQITVTVPGARAGDIDNVGKTALLEFRPVVAGPFTASAVTATPTPSGSVSGSATPAASGSATATGATAAPTAASSSGAPTTAASGASPQGAVERPLAAATPTPTPSAESSDATAPTAAATDTDATITPTPVATDTTVPTAESTAAATDAAPTAAPSVSGAAAVTDDQISAFAQQYSSVPGVSTMTEDQVKDIIAFQCGTDLPATDVNAPIVTCDQAGTSKYLLNKVLFPGTEVAGATAQAPGSSNVQWTVSLKLKSTGQKLWAAYTADHHNADSTGATTDTDPTHYVAFTLDGTVITAPNINATITGDTQISGSFTEASATDLANSLKYGALPLSFKELTSQTVSATLGTSQLKAGLLAGGIGLVLVVIYSLIYYRGLGLVTLASLVVSAGIVYASLVILGRQIGFTLTLAGVAGFIVAIGITADSFVVFFERIKDEVHEGRSMRVAVPRAWIRARRTVLSADFVSLLAAAVLYFLAAGDVRGFAFTLGLSTIIDIIVVFWFTHPIVSLLSRSRAFGSPRFTGLNSVRDGVVSGGGVRPRPARKATPSPARASAGTISLPSSSTALAVLEREDDGAVDETRDVGEPEDVAVPSRDDVDVATVEPDVVSADTDATDETQDVDDDTGDDDEDGDDVPPPATTRARRRSRSTASSTERPAAGGVSAAERAAARRARLRSDTPHPEDGK